MLLNKNNAMLCKKKENNKKNAKKISNNWCRKIFYVCMFQRSFGNKSGLVYSIEWNVLTNPKVIAESIICTLPTNYLNIFKKGLKYI